MLTVFRFHILILSSFIPVAGYFFFQRFRDLSGFRELSSRIWILSERYSFHVGSMCLWRWGGLWEARLHYQTSQCVLTKLCPRRYRHYLWDHSSSYNWFPHFHQLPVFNLLLKQIKKAFLQPPNLLGPIILQCGYSQSYIWNYIRQLRKKIYSFLGPRPRDGGWQGRKIPWCFCSTAWWDTTDVEGSQAHTLVSHTKSVSAENLSMKNVFLCSLW